MPLIILGALVVVVIIGAIIFRSRSIKADARKLEAQRKDRD